jgi:alpha-glucosidase
VRPAILLLVVVLSAAAASAADLTLSSPDGRLVVTVRVADLGPARQALLYRVDRVGEPVLADSLISLTCAEGGLLRDGLQVVSCVVTQRDTTWRPVWGERADVRDAHCEAVLTVRETNAPGRALRLTVRAYDDGVALRYALPDQAVTVQREAVEFRLPRDADAWATYSAQGVYSRTPVSQIKPGCERPLTIELATNLVVALGEAGLVDFARMKFAPLTNAPHAVVSHLDGPARLAAGAESPWRVVQVASSAPQLAEANSLFLNLNAPCALADTAWIKPGKVIREMTLTTAGARRLVDFADRRKLQYVHFDAGWYGHEYDDRADARGVHVDPKRSPGPLDLAEVIAYAKARDIGVLLYVNRRALERQLDELLPLYASWGVAGVKYGFVNVGSQLWTTWLHDAVRKAADHQLMVDVHDEYRPTGYSRTYPNLMTQEGILGDEEAKRALSQTIVHLYTRCLAGPADNTFCYFHERVARVSSHAAQLAKSVCLYSPWQYLYWYDRPPAPGEALRDGLISDEPELAFWDALPTTWDESRFLDGRIGEFAVVARRRGTDWFVGVLHSGTAPRNYDLPLDFLADDSPATATVYTDDPGLATRTRVAITTRAVRRGERLSIPLQAQGGAAVRITRDAP